MAESTAPADQGHASGNSIDIREVRLQPQNIWRVGWVVIALLAITLLLNFMIDDGGSVIFTVLMGWFASIAMEPAVKRLANHMRRGFATIIVILAVAAFFVIFFIVFGRLFIDQIAQLIAALPNLVESALRWVNETFNQTYSSQQILEQLNITPAKVSGYAQQFAGGIFACRAYSSTSGMSPRARPVVTSLRASFWQRSMAAAPQSCSSSSECRDGLLWASGPALSPSLSRRSGRTSRSSCPFLSAC